MTQHPTTSPHHASAVAPRLVVAVLLLLLAGCAGLGEKHEPPRVNLVSLELVEMQLLEQRYRLKLRVQNPNRDPIEIDGISFKVELNGRSFAHGVGRPTTEIAGFGEGLLEVEVISTLVGLIDQLRALEQRQDKPLSYRISGKLSLAGVPFGVPFERSGQLGGGEPPATAPAPEKSI